MNGGVGTSNTTQLSVLMPVYNGERYLADAVESILQQTFADFVFIIINDGSTDKSLSILEDFAEKDTRIRLISRENRGLVASLNEGLSEVNTPYVARMDADDIALPKRLELQMNYLNQHSNCALVGSRVVIIDEDDDEICEMGNHYSHDAIDNGLLSRGEQLIYHPSVIMKVSAVRQVGAYSENYPNVEDLDLFLKLAEVGQVHNLDTPLLKYREHFTKVGHLKQAEQHRQKQQVLEAAHQRRRLNFHHHASDQTQVLSQADRFRIWGWWAVKARKSVAAKKYAKRYFVCSPWQIESWKLIFSAYFRVGRA